MFFIIYKTTDLITGKIYIGKHKTNNLNDGYLGSGKLLLLAIKKRGRFNFKREILLFCLDEKEMDAKEKEIVDENFISRPDTYNMALGGYGGNFNEEILRKASYLGGQAVKKLFETDPKYRDNFSRKIKMTNERKRLEGLDVGGNFRGKHHSLDAKEKISKGGEKRLGNKNGSFGTIWITNDIENKKINVAEPIPDGWRRGRIQNNDSRKKKYLMIDPAGVESEIVGITEFCNKNSLNRTSLYKVSKGQLPHHRGWKCKEI